MAPPDLRFQIVLQLCTTSLGTTQLKNGSIGIETDHQNLERCEYSFLATGDEPKSETLTEMAPSDFRFSKALLQACTRFLRHDISENKLNRTYGLMKDLSLWCKQQGFYKEVREIKEKEREILGRVCWQEEMKGKMGERCPTALLLVSCCF